MDVRHVTGKKRGCLPCLYIPYRSPLPAFMRETARLLDYLKCRISLSAPAPCIPSPVVFVVVLLVFVHAFCINEIKKRRVYHSDQYTIFFIWAMPARKGKLRQRLCTRTPFLGTTSLQNPLFYLKTSVTPFVLCQSFS